MVESSEYKAILSILAEKGLNNVVNIVTLSNESKSLFQDFFDSVSNSEAIVKNSSNTEKVQVKKRIYVCTFCELFSSSKLAITSHINSAHGTSLPPGTNAEEFVSQLQALQNENDKKIPNKVGRPRKKESSTVVEDKALVSEPVKGSNGLYECQKCHRHFRKPRQFSRHVCLEIKAKNDFSCESEPDSDSTSDFQTYMEVEPTPWFRRPKRNNKSNEEKSQNLFQLLNNETLDDSAAPDSDDVPNKAKIYWRDDPNYVQIFENDEERYAFEKHLKSIDYSCVDNLFIEMQSKSKNCKKRNNFPKITLFSCILCQKDFRSLYHIRMHCLSHTDAKPFTCPKCSFCSSTKGSLYTHMRKHTGQLFNCSKCDFKSTKRAHLLEHEQTHSTVMQLCKLCKNSYKTLRTLLVHVHKYHNNPGGKKYAKFLSGKSSKDTFIKCNICQKKFKTQTSFSSHTHDIVSKPAVAEHCNINVENVPSTDVCQVQLSSASDTNTECSNKIQALKDPLAEIVLGDLLQQKSSEMYQNIFQQCLNPNIQTESDTASNTLTVESASRELSQFGINSQFETSNSVLQECEKTLSIDLINECLRHSNFADQVMAETCSQSSKLASNSESFGLHEIQMTFPNDSIISPSVTESSNLPNDLSHLDPELNVKKYPTDFVSTESKSVETKLFEKCRRAPAYVCCVCSNIYINPSTLKVHLKEHVNTNHPLIDQDEEEMIEAKMSEADAAIDSVCKILEDTPDLCSDNEKELEKLYTSSLDMMWYLPEVSVLLENDQNLIDAVLEDISNFPMPDKYDESEDLSMKCEEIF